MTTQNQAGGRRASVLQREFAAEILERFKKTGDVATLRHALEYFSVTGDFSPFSERDQHLQKQAIFLRLRARDLHGEALNAFIEAAAERLGQSTATVKRMLKRKTDRNSTLNGEDGLFLFLQSQARKNPSSSD